MAVHWNLYYVFLKDRQAHSMPHKCAHRMRRMLMRRYALSYKSENLKKRKHRKDRKNGKE